MENFSYKNPVQIVFGKGTVSQLPELLPNEGPVLMTYGSGSIKQNGLYDKIREGLSTHKIVEFGGIEPNPRYETLIRAVEVARKEKIVFLLAVGGGSVLDGTKFISAAIPFDNGDPWTIVSNKAHVTKAIPIGSVLTLPATGSEMNSYAVISRESTGEKLAFGSPLLYPQFSILDPETTISLPAKQIRNGIVDAWVHVAEQYLTFPCEAPLQDRQAEAVLLTLLEEGPKTLKNPQDYTTRANFVWTATNALNGWIGCGVPQDWSTHMIGHELTALYGLAHAETLAIVLPALLTYRKKQKLAKLSQYAQRVWGVRGGSDESRAKTAIDETVRFFQSLGMPTSLSDYPIPADAAALVAERFRKRGALGLGESGDITPEDVKNILQLCRTK